MKRHMHVISSCATPYFLAFVAVFLSRCAYDSLYFVVSERPLLLLSILIAALIYMGLLAFWALLSPRKIVKRAKYTKSL